MRTIRSLSAAAALALVVAVPAAAPSGAAEVAPTQGDRGAPVPVAGGPRAAGLVVTGGVGDDVVLALVATALSGVAGIDRLTRGPGSTRIIAFDRVVDAAEARRAADRLVSSGDLTSVEPDYIRSIADASPVSVNDPLFAQQESIWDVRRPGGGHSSKAPAFWIRTRGSAAVRVAVLDTGRTAHPDIEWLPGRDLVDNDDDPTDPGSILLGGSNGWHGTHVAGIVAARADNGIGVVGVAPGVSVVPVRVLDGAGDGADSDIAAGILWAAGVTVRGATNPAPVQVVNMSFGGSGACPAQLRDAIGEARARGVVMVAAAGNEAADAAGSVPANCPGVISVGAVDADGRRAPFSNFGATVDLSAPGVDVLSTVALGGGSYGYGRMSGTSMASPAVAGAAALLRSTGLSPDQVDATLPRYVSPAATAATAGVLSLRPRTQVAARVPSKVSRGGRALVRVSVRSSTGVRPSGRIVVYDGTRVVRRAALASWRNGNISVRTARLHRLGKHRIRVVYLGGGSYDDSRSSTRAVRVR